MDRNRIARGLCLIGAALAVLTVGTELSTERPRMEPANLLAQSGARSAAAPPETDGEPDECTATAGFWGAPEGPDAERGARGRVCKRYA